jgi:hypothetical protein
MVAAVVGRSVSRRAREVRMLRPPVGIAILGFLALLAGVTELIIGIQLAGFVVFGPGQTGSGFLFWGILTIIVGVIYAAVAFALWALQPWAWVFTWIMAIFGLFNAVLLWISTGEIVYGLGAALLPAVTLWYVNQPDIKALFGTGPGGPTGTGV